ncbi:MAG: hypothetical protein OXQ29_19715 [Rhodospirillaceae bacterium]|nr:hypothetical protein [Rhodospirillaceae bacterium]
MVIRLVSRFSVAVLVAFLIGGVAANYTSTPVEFAIGQAAETQDGYDETDESVFEFVSIFVCSGYAAAAGFAFGGAPGLAVSIGCGITMWA